MAISTNPTIGVRPTAQREAPRITDEVAWGAAARSWKELSQWNREQLEMLKRSERRRWSTILTLSMDAERRALGIGWLDRLEAAAAAYSFMVYRYRAYLPPPLRRHTMGHRRVVNTFAAERQQALPAGAYREWLRVDDDQPFNQDETAYVDGARANEPPNAGRWWWTNRDIGQFRPDEAEQRPT